MRRFILGPAVALASFVLVPAAGDGKARQAPSPARHGCRATFSIAQTKTQARRDYGGLGRVPPRRLRRLGWMERCQRNPAARWYVRWYDHLQARRHAERVYEAEHPWSHATASWYDDSSGRCASGPCVAYGVANLSLAFGTRVEFSYGGRTVWAVVDDRGPYVGGRTWDLDQNVAGALGFGGVGSVGYRLG